MDLSQPVSLRDDAASAIRANDEFVRLRRDIHAHPETGFEEHRTAALVAERLEAWGWTVVRGLGGTGLVGSLSRGAGGRAIGLRADMDALPIHEANAFAHASTVPGKMHACGHDGHTAMLLAAAWYLGTHGRFDGTVHCIFQPAEESGQAGAKAMIDDGLFERFPCDAVFGVHNWPGADEGDFLVRSGAFMGSSNRFRIEIAGKGGHAAQPEFAVDPMIAGAQILLGLQSVMSRNRAPNDPAVLSVTQFHGGNAVNVIPDSAWLAGTVRTHSLEVLDMVERRMREIVESTGAAYGCAARLDFERCYPPLVNDPAQTAFAAGVMRGLAGGARVDDAAPLVMGSEDFSFMLQARPGCYAFLGAGRGEHRLPGHGAGPCTVHNPSYDFNDALLPLGGAYFVELAEEFLAAD